MSKKSWGIVCLIGPFLLFVLMLIGYAVAAFLLTASGDPVNDPSTGDKVRAVFGLITLVDAIIIVPCFITGLVLLLKKKK